MGGMEFCSDSKGKDVKDAFNKAHEAAAWESGHGGYTGTIAEKHTAIELKYTTRFKRRSYLYTDGKELAAALRRGRASLSWGTEGVDTPQLKELRRVAKKMKIPWERIELAATIYDDKWGPALAVRIE